MRLPFWIFWGLLAAVPAAFGSEERHSFFNIELLQVRKITQKIVNDRRFVRAFRTNCAKDRQIKSIARLNEINRGNLILSPTSAKVALLSLIEGTGGRTYQELVSALRLPPEDYNIKRIIESVLQILKRSKNGTEIDVATRLWVNPSITISPTYAATLQRQYSTDVWPANFRDANSVAQMINDWVSTATRQNIQSIVQPDTIAPDTQLLLTSALYFKGRWLKAFDRALTRTQCFTVPDRGCQNVPMMENISKYRYAYVPTLDADVVEIPYSDGRTSMLIFLPSNANNDPYLQTLSKDLSYVPISILLANLMETEMLLVIPRFSIENKVDLQTPLMRMNVVDIFGAGANFTKIGNNDYLRISNIIQNAKIEVDEEGTIAAAVTEITVLPLMGMGQDFIANRPFIFAIVDLPSSEMLFAGRLMDPTVKSSRLN